MSSSIEVVEIVVDLELEERLESTTIIQFASFY